MIDSEFPVSPYLVDHPADLSVLVVHDRYRRPGGEDTVVAAEIELLRSLGVPVASMIYDNRDESQMRSMMRRPDRLVFNQRSYDEVQRLVHKHQATIVHCHNLYPLVSTSVYAAAQVCAVPIVQTVHNYRMGCLNGVHLLNGVICERCRPGHHLSGILHRCYRDSFLQSAGFGLAQTVNSWYGRWQQPTLYVAPSAFVQTKLVEWGISPQKVVIKPHFVGHDPGTRASPGSYAVFIGRLSAEKGLDRLLDVWDRGRLPLVVAGDGPLRDHLEQRVEREGRTNVRFIGFQNRAGIDALLQEAQFLVVPSHWYEVFGMVLIEAYAHGVPVVAGRIGGLPDVVRDGATGLLFTYNDSNDLRCKLDQMEHDHDGRAKMSRTARMDYETLYSRTIAGPRLLTVYQQARSLYRTTV